LTGMTDRYAVIGNPIALFVWRGVRPATAPVLAMLRA